MGRPIKEGLEFFPMNVDFYDDPKIIYAEEKHGAIGGYIANRLLCAIYREGYFIRWDEDSPLIIAKRLGNGITSSVVKEVVNSLLEKSFFHPGLFSKYGILTSHGIQSRWKKIVLEAKRKCVINSIYDVDNYCIAEFIQEETQAEPEESTQSKVKESKVNNPPIVPPPGDGDNPPDDEQTVVPDWMKAFRQFWDVYGKKEDRAKCEKKFAKLSAVDIQAILAHVPAYVAVKSERKFRKNPYTYLNSRCWDDEDLPDGTPNPLKKQTEAQRTGRWAKAVRAYEVPAGPFIAFENDLIPDRPLTRREYEDLTAGKIPYSQFDREVQI